MSGLFYNLGRKVGPKVRKVRWLWQSIAGTEEDAIKIEHEVGLDIDHEVRRKLKIIRKKQIDKILNEIYSSLTECVVNKYRKLKLEVVKGKEHNDFAMTGGFILVINYLMEL